MSKPATPAKLRSGDWGARVQGSATAGDTVRITTRSGKSWNATVTRVVWTGNGVSLCETVSASQRDGNDYHRAVRGVDYCGYPCPVDGHRCTATNPCHDCT